MELIQAKPEDFDRVRAFYDRVIDLTPGMDVHARWKKRLHPSDEGLRGYLAEGDLYLLEENGSVAGAMAVTLYQGEDYRLVPWGVAAEDDEVAVLHLLAVDPDRQGQGVAHRLIGEALALARRNGKKAFRLDAVSTNAPARRLYASLDFAFRGTQNLYAPNTGWTDFCYFEQIL